jgi:hypothetical protein
MSKWLMHKLPIWLLVLMLCSCANLGSIKEFSAISSDSAGYTALTEEYATSPERLKKYTLEANEAQRTILTNQASERRAQVEKLRLFHKAVSAYMSALAELSSDELVSYDDDIAKLTSEAVAGGFLDDREVNSVNQISGLIARAATDNYRQRKLKVVLREANAPLQALLSTMESLIRAYGSSLRNEKAAVSSYYRALIATARDEKQSAYAEELWLKSQAESERLDSRISAATGYSKTISNISSAHQKLFDERNRVSDKEVQRQIREYSSRIREAYKEARGES